MSRRSSRLLTQADAAGGDENVDANVGSKVHGVQKLNTAASKPLPARRDGSNIDALTTVDDSSILMNIKMAYKFAKSKKRKKEDMCDDSMMIYCDNDIYMNSYISFNGSGTLFEHLEEKIDILSAYKVMIHNQKGNPPPLGDDSGHCSLHDKSNVMLTANTSTSADLLAFSSYESCESLDQFDDQILSPPSPEIVNKTNSSRLEETMNSHAISLSSGIKNTSEYDDSSYVLRKVNDVDEVNSLCLNDSINLLELTSTCTPIVEFSRSQGEFNSEREICYGELLINEASTLIADICTSTHPSMTDNDDEVVGDNCRVSKDDSDDVNNMSCSTSLSNDKNSSNNFLAILNRRNLTNFRKVTRIGRRNGDDDSTYANTGTNTLNNPDTMPYCTGGYFGNEEYLDNNDQIEPCAPPTLQGNTISVPGASMNVATNESSSNCNSSHRSSNAINQDDPLNISEWDLGLWSRVSLVQPVLPLPIYIINKIKANGVLLYIPSRNFRENDNIALEKSVELSQQLNVKMIAISLVDKKFLSYEVDVDVDVKKTTFQNSMSRKKRVFFDKCNSYKKLLSSKYHVPHFLLHSGGDSEAADDEAFIICSFIDNCLQDNVIAIISDDYCNVATFHKVWKMKESVPIFLVNNNIADNVVGNALSTACGSPPHISVSPYFENAEKFVYEAIIKIENESCSYERSNLGNGGLYSNHNCQVIEAENAIRFNASSKNDFIIVNFNKVEDINDNGDGEHFKWSEENLLLYYKNNVTTLKVVDEGDIDKRVVVEKLLKIEKFRQIVLNGLMLGIISPFFVVKFAQTNNSQLYNSHIRNIVAEFEVLMVVSSCFSSSNEEAMSPEAILSKYISASVDGLKVHVDTFNASKTGTSELFFPHNLRKGTTSDRIFNYIQDCLVTNGLFYDGLFFNYYFLYVLMNIKSVTIAMKIVLYEVVSYITYNHSRAGDNLDIVLQVLFKYHRLMVLQSGEVTHTNLIDYIYCDTRGNEKISVSDIVSYIDANIL